MVWRRSASGSVAFGRRPRRPYRECKAYILGSGGGIGCKGDIFLGKGVIAVVVQPFGDPLAFGVEAVAVKHVARLDTGLVKIGHYDS